MNDKHLPLVIDFLYLGPAEVMRFARSLKCQNAAVVYTQVELRPSVILNKEYNFPYIYFLFLTINQFFLKLNSKRSTISTGILSFSLLLSLLFFYYYHLHTDIENKRARKGRHVYRYACG